MLAILFVVREFLYYSCMYRIYFIICTLLNCFIKSRTNSSLVCWFIKISKRILFKKKKKKCSTLNSQLWQKPFHKSYQFMFFFFFSSQARWSKPLMHKRLLGGQETEGNKVLRFRETKNDVAFSDGIINWNWESEILELFGVSSLVL